MTQPSAVPAKHRALHDTLQQRFEAHPHRHATIDWSQVVERLAAKTAAWPALAAMEASSGEPDVVLSEGAEGAWIYCDCARESPADRRSLCYDRAALDARKQNKPTGCVTEAVAALRTELLDEAAYARLQSLDEFDLKTSSWLATPDDVRSRGGALFGDRRYGRVFVYHNGADSYYAARGFRTLLRL